MRARLSHVSSVAPFRLSLVLCKGKEEIERKNSLLTNSSESLALSGATPSLYRRLAQTDADTELVSDSVSEGDIRAAMTETQINADELEEKAKVGCTAETWCREGGTSVG